MDEVSRFQVSHGRGDLGRHVHEDDLGDLRSIGASQVVKKISPGHEFGDDVEGRLSRAHSQKLDEIRVSHLLHDGGLFEEVGKFHGILLKEYKDNEDGFKKFRSGSGSYGRKVINQNSRRFTIEKIAKNTQ